MEHRNLIGFSLKNVAKRLNSINIIINLQNHKPFPKSKERTLSWYTYQNRWVRISDNGYFNRARLVTSLINFSFVKIKIPDSLLLQGTTGLTDKQLCLQNYLRLLNLFFIYKIKQSFCGIFSQLSQGCLYRC